jgi:hypothetical protein
MALDALSINGMKAIEQSRIGLSLIGREYVETRQDREGDIDGFFLSKDGKEIVAAFEVKARNMTLAQLQNQFKNEWILTFEKINKGSAISRSLCIPFFGVVYLIPDAVTLLVQLCDDKGNPATTFRVDNTETQATCNGGKASRSNAYISMKSAKQFRGASC